MSRFKAPRAVSSRSLRSLRSRIEPLRERLAIDPVGQLGVLLERLQAVRVIESALALAAQCFLALFPLLIAIVATAPPRAAAAMVQTLRDRLGFGSGSVGALQNLLADPGELRSNLSLISFVIIVGSATAFTRTLQRMYQRAWDVPPLGLRGLWRGVAWLAGIAVYFVGLGIAIRLTGNLGISGLIGSIAGVAMWWWTPYLLLGGRVSWRALLPGAILTALGQLILSSLSAVFVPRMIRSNELQYGTIGTVFAIESWLVIVCGVFVIGGAFGAALGRGPGLIGRLVRGTADPEGWRRRPPQRPSPRPTGTPEPLTDAPEPPADTPEPSRGRPPLP
jgi:membrane protein